MLPKFLLIITPLLITGCGITFKCSRSPFITGQPSDQTVAVGQRALYTVAAPASIPPSYQWMKNGIAIPNATQASYITPVTSAADVGSSFSVALANTFGKLTSRTASLNLDPSVSSKTRYVATTGNDSNAGTIDHPYRTIQYCASTVAAGWTCEVRAGTYRETIIPNSEITIASSNFESVIVDGSDPVTGWTQYQGSIFKASANLSADDTNQIFVAGEMMTEARWPNGDDLFNVNWARASDGTDLGQIVDSKLPHVDWTGAKIHLWSGSDPWGNETGDVTASSSGRVAIDIGRSRDWCPALCPIPGGYYYLFGTLSALDAEREWFYDSNSNTIYFMAPGGVDPNTIDVRSKQRQYAFDLRGKSGVTIRDIAIFASTIVTDKSSARNTLDRIDARYLSHFTTLPADSPGGILFVHLGDSGIIINGTGNIVQNSTIAYSAGNGIALEGTNNIIRNNLIHHVDYIGDYASGIVLDGDGNMVQYNTVHSIGRQAILFNAVINQDVGYNDLRNSMMLTRDGAEIYACCKQAASGTRIHHNWIHDTQSLFKGPGDDGSLSGVYIDNGSGGFNVDQNVLWNNRFYNIFINGISGGDLNNTIQNNTIPDNSSDGSIRVINVHDCASTRIINNRVVVSIRKRNNDTTCNISNNGYAAPGAIEMLDSTSVGCNFSGCSSNVPPTIVDEGLVAPCQVSSFARH